MYRCSDLEAEVNGKYDLESSISIAALLGEQCTYLCRNHVRVIFSPCCSQAYAYIESQADGDPCQHEEKGCYSEDLLPPIIRRHGGVALCSISIVSCRALWITRRLMIR